MASIALFRTTSKKTPEAVTEKLLSICGITCNRSWLILLFIAFADAPALTPSLTMDVVALFGCVITVFCVALLSRNINRIRLSLYQLAVCLSTLSLILYGLSIVTQAQLFFLFAALTCGVASALMQICWAKAITNLYHKDSLSCFAWSSILFACLILLIIYCNLIKPFVAILALCSVLLYALVGAKGENPHKAEKPAPSPRSTYAGTGFVSFAVSVCVFSFAGRTMDLYLSSQVGVLPFKLRLFYYSSFVIAGVILLIVALLGKRRPGKLSDPSFLYRLILPLSVAGLAALSLSVIKDGISPLLLTTIGYALFHTLFWSTMVSLADKQKYPEVQLKTFSLGLFAVYLGMMLGRIFGRILSSGVFGEAINSTTLSIAYIVLLVALFVTLLPDAITGTLRKPATNLDNSVLTARALACSELAERYQLTPREEEIFVLLAEGKNADTIAKQLGVSNSTIRTHIKSIYCKADVHRHQDLIVIVDEATNSARNA